LALLAVGMLLVYFGLDAVGPSVHGIAGGRFSDLMTLCLTSGAAAAISGVVIFDGGLARSA
jgi:hypothetical protein